jgi:CMP-N-acetylneuraminic acid synthetase
MRLGVEDRLQPLLPLPAATRRQDLPPVYVLNGAVYAARASFLRQHKSFTAEGAVGYIMPSDRSIDIDTIEDFERFVRLTSGEHR